MATAWAPNHKALPGGNLKTSKKSEAFNLFARILSKLCVYLKSG